ncbi:MAG: hypothetical protein ABJR05_16750 [Balneola sp.]
MIRIYSCFLVMLFIVVGCSENSLDSTGFTGLNDFDYQISVEIESWDLVVMDSGQKGPDSAYIYRYNIPDYNEREVLVDSVFGYYEITASQNGRYIAFLKDNTPNSSNSRFQKIWIYDLKEQRELKTNIGDINYHTFSMKWSPTENKLLITNQARGQENYKMHILSVETMQAEVIIETSSILNPEWSFDGNYVSYMKYESFEVDTTAIGNVLDLSTREVTTITDGLALSSNLKWSTKENRLFFVEVYNEYYYLSSISINGSVIKRLIKGNMYEPQNLGGFPIVPGPLPVNDNTISVYPSGDYLNIHNYGFTQEENTYRVLIDVNNQTVKNFKSNFIFYSNVYHTSDGKALYMRGKYQQETFTHLYVALPNGNELTPLVKALASGGEVLVPKF